MAVFEKKESPLKIETRKNIIIENNWTNNENLLKGETIIEDFHMENEQMKSIYRNDEE